MKVEYETIAKAGLVLQVDDAWLPALWDRIGMQMGHGGVPQVLHDCASRR